MSFQREKKLILDFYQSLEKSQFKNLEEFTQFCSENLQRRGFHPLI